MKIKGESTVEKNTYAYKQLLLGMRREYLIIKKELDELNKYIENLPNNKYEYRFRLGLPLEFSEEETCQLMLDVKTKKTEFFHRLRYVLQNMNVINKKQTSTEMEKNEHGIYIPKKIINGKIDKRFAISILPGSEKEFSERVDRLKSSEFSKHMYYTKDELKNFMRSNNGQIWQTLPDYSQSFSNSELNLTYKGIDDLIQLGSIWKQGEEPKPITNEALQRVMNIEIPKTVFSPYHRDIIESKLSPEKEIIFSEDYVPTTYSNFSIEERKNALVLHKTK